MTRNLLVVLFIGFFAVPTFASTAFLTEVNYDYPGNDECEFLEVALPSLAARVPQNTTVTLYNGSTGVPYASETVDNFIFGDSVVIGGELVDLYYWELPANGIQNGGPDGLSIDENGVVCEFLSYEGTFTAVGGPADGLMSTDIGIADSNAAGNEGISLQLNNGIWTMGSKTPGLENVPEPTGWMLLSISGLLMGLQIRRTRG